MENVSYKVFFKNYGIFLAVITVIFGILIYSIILSKKSWNNNLRIAVEKVLDEQDPNQWTIGNNRPIKNPLSLTSACYEVRNRRTGEIFNAVIIRVETFYGPLPAVYICDSENNVTFIGYSSLHGRIEKIIKSNSGDKRIEYWQKKIPYVIGTVQKEAK